MPVTFFIIINQLCQFYLLIECLAKVTSLVKDLLLNKLHLTNGVDSLGHFTGDDQVLDVGYFLLKGETVFGDLPDAKEGLYVFVHEDAEAADGLEVFLFFRAEARDDGGQVVAVVESEGDGDADRLD